MRFAAALCLALLLAGCASDPIKKSVGGPEPVTDEGISQAASFQAYFREHRVRVNGTRLSVNGQDLSQTELSAYYRRSACPKAAKELNSATWPGLEDQAKVVALAGIVSWIVPLMQIWQGEVPTPKEANDRRILGIEIGAVAGELLTVFWPRYRESAEVFDECLAQRLCLNPQELADAKNDTVKGNQ